MAQKKSRYWTFIIYPESVVDNYIDILISTGLPITISPLHDRDKNPDGTLKKAHYHVLACWDGPTTYNCVKDLCEQINATNPQAVMSIRGMYRYFCHLDNPEKEQYLDNDRNNLNGFDIFNYSSFTENEQCIMTRQIENIIIDFCFSDYYELMLALPNIDLSLYNYARNHTLYFNTFIKGLRFRYNEMIALNNKTRIEDFYKFTKNNIDNKEYSKYTVNDH